MQRQLLLELLRQTPNDGALQSLGCNMESLISSLQSYQLSSVAAAAAASTAAASQAMLIQAAALTASRQHQQQQQAVAQQQQQQQQMIQATATATITTRPNRPPEAPLQSNLKTERRSTTPANDVVPNKRRPDANAFGQCDPLDLSVVRAEGSRSMPPHSPLDLIKNLAHEYALNGVGGTSDWLQKIGEQTRLITSSTSPASSNSSPASASSVPMGASSLATGQSAISSSHVCDMNNNNNNSNNHDAKTQEERLKVPLGSATDVITSTNGRRRRPRRVLKQTTTPAPRRQKGAMPAPSATPSPSAEGANATQEKVARAKSHLCNHCGRSFARSDMLTRHARLHSGHKPYQCGECFQVFSRSDHLSTHERTHTGEKPYQCNQCAYSACRRDMITRHMRTHASGGRLRAGRTLGPSKRSCRAGKEALASVQAERVKSGRRRKRNVSLDSDNNKLAVIPGGQIEQGGGSHDGDDDEDDDDGDEVFLG